MFRSLTDTLLALVIVLLAVLTFPLWYFYARAIDKLVVKSAPNPTHTHTPYDRAGEQ